MLLKKSGVEFRIFSPKSGDRPGVELCEIGKLHQNKTSRPKLSVDAAEIQRLRLVDIDEILQMFHVNFMEKIPKKFWSHVQPLI